MVMGRDAQLVGRHPELQEAGIDVHDGGAPKEYVHRRVHGVIEVEQEVGETTTVAMA
jgi:hypothetical protein